MAACWKVGGHIVFALLRGNRLGPGAFMPVTLDALQEDEGQSGRK